MGASACPAQGSRLGEYTRLASCGSCEIPIQDLNVTVESGWDNPNDEEEEVNMQGAHAEEHQLRWINYVAGVMWPYMRKAIMKKADAIFRERMGEELMKHPEVKLTELKLDFDPGTTPPYLARMRVYHRCQQEREAVQVDSDFSWVPSEDFHLIFTCIGHARKIPIKAENIGITEMRIGGTLSALLSPLLNYAPCVGTAQAFFLDTPSIHMKLQGVKKLGPIGSVITNVMEGVVSNVLAEGFILPHRFVQKIRKDLPLETMVNCKTPLPMGMLQIEVLEAKDLPAADTSITGKKSSDPFVKIKVGYDSYRTSTVENTLNPQWDDPPGHLFVYNATQIVRITVQDDDLMGDDVLGQVLGYDVVSLCRECENDKDIWLDVRDAVDPSVPAGQVRVKVKYFDVADLAEVKASQKPDSKAPPYLLTVKLLGLEGEERGDMKGARCMIEQIYPTGKDDEDAKNGFQQKNTSARASRLMGGLEAATSAVQHARQHVREKTGLGFGHRQDGVLMKRKSCKAVPWGSTAAGHLEDAHHQALPPLAIRAMEKLHVREGWKTKDIADMFALDESIVNTAVCMRGNFEVIWAEATQFLQPSDNPFKGKVKVSVSAPAHQQVRGADDHGFIGELTLDLEPSVVMGDSIDDAIDKPWCRRVRRELKRPRAKGALGTKKVKEEEKGTKLSSAHSPLNVRSAGIFKGTVKNSHHAAKVTATDNLSRMQSFGETEKEELDKEEAQQLEGSGIVLEFLVEIRKLEPAICNLEPGQQERSREELRAASMNSGVEVTKA